MTKLNLSGNKFHRLTVIKFSNIISKSKKPLWWCVCICGNGVLIDQYSILSSTVRSCGCFKTETLFKMIKTRQPKRNLVYDKGERRTAEYFSWCAMKNRCYNKNYDHYKDYGGRGITVCDRWLNSYKNFLTDLGRRPPDKHSLDRIRVNDNYEPGNCRWATWTEQANNKRRHVPS